MEDKPDNLVELLLILDAFRRASARRINVLVPYFPYARQDRMASGREAISLGSTNVA